MSNVCSISVSPGDWDQIKQCEAVVVVEYEDVNGIRFGRIEAWGDLDEMEDQASTYRIVVVRDGAKIVAQTAVKVGELGLCTD